MISDIVFQGGSVYTADKNRTIAQAAAVKNGKIVYVGDSAGAREYIGEETQVINLQGKTLLPSFFEGHCHYAAATNAVVGVNLAGMHTAEEYVQACKSYLREHPGIVCLRGQGYLEACFPGEGPKKELLDQVSRDIPIVLLPETLHSLWANSKAIQLAGITADTPDPKNGKIERDENGQPSGCFREGAQHLILDALPEMSVEEYKKGILAYQEMAHSLGFTGAYDAWLDDGGRNVIYALRQLDQEGKLSMRLRGAYWLNPQKGPEQIDQIVAWRQEDNNGNLFQINSVKFFLDGILESYTALMLEPYCNCPGYPQGWKGDRIWDDDNLRACLLAADKAGLTAHFHCYGDGAVRQALDAIEYVQNTNGKRDARHCITHVFLANPQDIPRFKELGVVAMLNSYWAQIDETFFLNGKNIGEHRESHSFPMESFFKAGVVTANASDYPITAVPSPFIGMEIGMTRKAPDNYHPWIFDYENPLYHQPLWPEERSGLEDMIDSFTIAPAYANFVEGLSGSIEVGKNADLVLADKDLFSVDVEDIATIQVEKTLFLGKIVYER